MESLTGEGIVLRPFRDADLQQFVAAVQESANTLGAWMSWWKPDYSEQDAREWFDACAKEIAAANNYDIGIFLADDSKLVGGISINHIDHANKFGNIGYWVRESMQNCGHCTKAVARIARFGFDELGLMRLEIIVLVDNVPSRRVAEKCGAKLDCIADNRLVLNDRSLPAAVYALLAP